MKRNITIAERHTPSVGWFDRFDNWCSSQVWWVQILACMGVGTVLACIFLLVLLFFGEIV